MLKKAKPYLQGMLVLLISLSPLVSGEARGESVGEIIQSVWNRGLYFDRVRFDTTAVRGLINDSQDMIATLGRTNQSDTTIVMEDGEYKWIMPTGWFEIITIHLNVDPEKAPGPQKRLAFVPIDEWGRKSSQSNVSRPQQWTIWGDTVIVERPTQNYTDTLSVKYVRRPVLAADTASAVDLPGRYISILKEIVIQSCIERITFPGRSPRDEAMALTRLVQEALLSREADSN